MTLIRCAHCGRTVELVDDGHGAVLMGHRADDDAPGDAWCAGGGRRP